MRNVRGVSAVCLSSISIGLLAVALISPALVRAQTGYNAVCTSSPPAGVTCSQYTSSSSGVLDASTFTGADLCAKINSALVASPAVGAVIDARGIGSGTNQSCASSPWNGITNPHPSVILLPSGQITIPATWVLPNYTRIYGQGQRGSPASSGTVIAANSSSFAAGTPMIQFGASTVPPSAPSCTSAPLFGISVQDLMLDGNTLDIIGILNECSQETSYVDRVNLYEIAGTGLYVTGLQAQNSGPYSNIACNPGGTYTTATTCANLNTTGDLRGIHGFTATVASDACTMSPTTCPTAAIYLDTNNATIEDAHFEGFADGILVGSYSSTSSSAKGNVIVNANGAGSASATGPTYDVIEISANTNTTSGNPNVSDLSIIGVTWASNPAATTNSIKDDLTVTTLPDSHLAMYVIGDVVSTTSGTGYSRFTTSTSDVAPNWGAGALGTGKPNGSCIPGALFSNTTGAAKNILFLCSASGWVALPY
jgi:hypothetical protein